jgi:hypothetical protein
MLSFNRSRFISDQAVKQSLTSSAQLPAKLNTNLCLKLGLPEGTIIQSLTKAFTKGVGGTQCRPYIVTLQNGEKIFLKLSPSSKNAIAEQTKADQNIQGILGKENTHPFICMIPGSGMVAHENATYNELLFFPFVPGDNLFITMTCRNANQNDTVFQFAGIGKCLAKMHLQSMVLTDTYDKFMQNDCRLSKVLIHDDWQSTNIMITPENNAIIIDTEGTTYSDIKPYRNIAESWDLSGNNFLLMNVLIDAYVNEFSPELQEQIAFNVKQALLVEHGLDLNNSSCKSAYTS